MHACVCVHMRIYECTSPIVCTNTYVCIIPTLSRCFMTSAPTRISVHVDIRSKEGQPSLVLVGERSCFRGNSPAHSQDERPGKRGHGFFLKQCRICYAHVRRTISCYYITRLLYYIPKFSGIATVLDNL